MATSEIIFIQGGGVGYAQEIALRRLLGAVGVPCDWQMHYAGQAALEKGYPALSDNLLEAVRKSGIALKTKIVRPINDPETNYNVLLRRKLGCFASVRPLRNLDGLPSRFNNINILLVREITEDLYAAIEHEIVPGVVQSLQVVTEAACTRFFKFTFELARQQGRKSVHCIHKANILKLADGLVLDCFRKVAGKFPEITPREMIVDNCCMQLVSKPSQFEVLATGNLYGDLLSDLGAGLIGGITLAEGINYGDGVKVYECIHGGDNTGFERQVNPLPLVSTALHLLRDIGQSEPAQKLHEAIVNMLTTTNIRTSDLGGSDTTETMVEAILKRIA
ncbi:MAG TPA: isocitrate/isopropylmalate family dehydrogenase [Gemmatales bacterium]|nr:isocitrate/isopropylmalate family dehydrogenase [Gemmatales bacterium]